MLLIVGRHRFAIYFGSILRVFLTLTSFSVTSHLIDPSVSLLHVVVLVTVIIASLPTIEGIINHPSWLLLACLPLSTPLRR
jgi:uncharacterized membrane protein YhdT